MHAMMRTKSIVSNNEWFYIKTIYVNMNIAYMLSYALDTSFLGHFVVSYNIVWIHTCSDLLKLAEGSKLL